MSKVFLNIFLLISLAGFWFLPKYCLAENELSENEANILLSSVQQKLIDEWIEITSSPDFSEPEKQVAIFLIRNAIQKKELSYGLEEIPKEYLKEIVKTGASLLINPDISTILDKLEKESVKQAVKIAEDWLLQNEIKIAKGPLNYSYTSYKGNEQKPKFHFLINYHPLSQEEAEIIIEFYSPEEIEPPYPKGSTVLGLGTSIWEIEQWLNQGNKKLSPFIVKVKGKVNKIYGGYIWDESSFIEITFSEPVPASPFEEEPTSFWGKVKKGIKDELSKTVDSFTDIFDIFSKIKEKIPDVSLLGGQSSQSLSVILQDGKLEKIQGMISSLEQDIEKIPEEKEKEEVKEEKKESVKNIPSIEDLQKRLSDLKEIIKGLEGKLKDILKESPEELEEQVEKKEEESEEKTVEKTSFIACKKKETDKSLRNKIIFNEIAWMGSSNSANDEWIEIKNVSNSDINLFGWQILDKEEQIKIIFNQTLVKNNGFLLLERTDDDSVPNIMADFIYSGALNNNNEVLYLFDKNCQLQDEILAEPDWPAGDNSSKKTMERKSDLTWQTSAIANGTPKAENSQGSSISVPPAAAGGGGSGGSGGGGGAGAPPAPVSPTPEQISYPKILISEIKILPIEERFIKLYNPNDQDVDLTDWYIQRKTETGTSWSSLVSSTKFEGKIIQSRSHFLIARTSTYNPEIVLEDLTLTENNTILIKNPNREIVDKVGWGEAQDFETAPTLNPTDGENIIRKWSAETQNYIDTDNNQNDFEVKITEPELTPAEVFWPMLFNNSQNTSASSKLGPETNNIEWTKVLEEVSLDKNPYVSFQPIIGKEETIYIGIGYQEDNSGKLYALDSKGEIKWFFDTAGIPGTPATRPDGTVFIGTIASETDPGKVFALDFEGNKKWEFSEAGASSINLSSNNVLYFSSEDLYALNSETGELIWQFQQPEEFFNQPALAADGTIYAVFPGWWKEINDKKQGALYALNPVDGTIKWQAEELLGYNMSAPIVDEQGNIYVAGDELFAFNPDGTLKWKELLTQNISEPWLTLAPDQTIIAGGLGILSSFNLAGQKILDFQKQEKPSENPEKRIIEWSESPIIDSQGNIFITGSTFNDSSTYSRLYSLKKESGAINWYFDINWWEEFLSLPAIGSDNHLYIVSLYKEENIKQVRLYGFGPTSQICSSEDCQEPIPSQSVWQMFNSNSRNTGVSPVFGPESGEIVIESLLGQEGGTDYYGSMAIASNNNIYMIARINLNTGIYLLDSQAKKKWFYEVPDIGMIYSWPAIGDDSVYLMSLHGLIALDYSARFKWKFELEYMFNNTSPIIDQQGIVYIATHYREGDFQGSGLFAIDKEGKELWRKSFARQSDRDTETPAIGPDGTIYFIYTNILYAFNPDGSEKWHLAIGELPHGIYSLTYPVVSSEGIIFTRSDYLYAVSPNGELLWSISEFERLQPRALSPDEKTLYATAYPCWGSMGSVFARLVAIDILTGQVIWTKDFPYNILDALTVDAKGNIYIHYGTRSGIIGLNSQGEEIISQFVSSFRWNLILGKEQSVFLPGQDVLYLVKPK